MSQEGDDTSFLIRFDQTYVAKELKLQTFICDNLFMPWYKSKNLDFRQLGVIVGGITYQYTIDQNLESFEQIVEWFNGQGSPFKLVIVLQTKTYLNTLSVKVQSLLNVDQVSQLTGDAWKKLGFDIPSQTTTTHNSVRSFDFSQSPAIAVVIRNLPRPFDQFSFLLPNNSSFGSKVFYNSQQNDNTQTIRFNQAHAFNYMQIQLLNCDMQQLETPRQNNTKTSDNELEVLMVFDILN